MSTSFKHVYNRFLGKITDDLYVELTPEDTIRDLQRLLINAIPDFEFPRKDLEDYYVKTIRVHPSQLHEDDFVLDVVEEEIDGGQPDGRTLLVERSEFNETLTPEEMNILAILMMIGWLQRQVTSIENIRMKYSGADFKMTSQANHLAKLLIALSECQRQSIHMQRLYKRRRPSTAADLHPITGKTTGAFASNWDMLRFGVYNRKPGATAQTAVPHHHGLVIQDVGESDSTIDGGSASTNPWGPHINGN